MFIKIIQYICNDLKNVMISKMDITLQNIEQYLNKKGLSPLLHRVKVLEYFVKHRNPTVDIIHKDLSKEIPSLSKTTVYFRI